MVSEERLLLESGYLNAPAPLPPAPHPALATRRRVPQVTAELCCPLQVTAELCCPLQQSWLETLMEVLASVGLRCPFLGQYSLSALGLGEQAAQPPGVPEGGRWH